MAGVSNIAHGQDLVHKAFNMAPGDAPFAVVDHPCDQCPVCAAPMALAQAGLRSCSGGHSGGCYLC